MGSVSVIISPTRDRQGMKRLLRGLVAADNKTRDVIVVLAAERLCLPWHVSQRARHAVSAERA
jgi:hypothetical protein